MDAAVRHYVIIVNFLHGRTWKETTAYTERQRVAADPCALLLCFHSDWLRGSAAVACEGWRDGGRLWGGGVCKILPDLPSTWSNATNHFGSDVIYQVNTGHPIFTTLLKINAVTVGCDITLPGSVCNVPCCRYFWLCTSIWSTLSLSHRPFVIRIFQCIKRH